MAFSVGLLSATAYGQTIPGAADVGRVQSESEKTRPVSSEKESVSIPAAPPAMEIPPTAKNVHFTLKEVRIEGMSAFSNDDMQELYASNLNKEVSLDIAWTLAGAITERYRNAGYFLTRAYVPEQRVTDGVITIRVVEGYIGKVESKNEIAQNYVIQKLTDDIKTEKPLSTKAMESFLLRLNDIPGISVKGILSSLDGGEEGAVKLTLAITPKSGSGALAFDNYGSRFLGPHEVSASYSGSILPMQQTSILGLTTIPLDELQYATLTHAITILPNLSLELNGNVTRAEPGYNLEPFDIDSKAVAAAIKLRYQWIRQREQNLALSMSLTGRDTHIDLLHTAFVRDHVRAVRAELAYDIADRWNGATIAYITLSKGLKIFGSSDENDRNLSRAEADPDFTKLELSLARQQDLSPNWSVRASAYGQISSDPLFSSEEIGYGGQSFGRAFDASEITGDHGIMGSLELRYQGFRPWHDSYFVPYIFYDIGKVWNDDAGQSDSESGSSTGLGMRFDTVWNMSGNLSVALPLTRDISTPLYGESNSSPRLLFQISKQF